MDISRIQVNQALREERPGSTEGVTGKVLSRQNNTLEILVGDNVVKVEARAAGKIVPGDVVQVFFGEDTLRTARLGQERPNPVTAKLIDVFSLSFPFPLDENTTRIVEGFSDSEKIGFSRLVSEINRIVGLLLQETLAQGALETAEGTRDSFFSVNIDELRSSIVELALRVKNTGKAWQELPQRIKEEIVKAALIDPLLKKAELRIGGAIAPSIADKAGKEVSVSDPHRSEEKHATPPPDRPGSETRAVSAKSIPLTQDSTPASETESAPEIAREGVAKESIFARLRPSSTFLSSLSEHKTTAARQDPDSGFRPSAPSRVDLPSKAIWSSPPLAEPDTGTSGLRTAPAETVEVTKTQELASPTPGLDGSIESKIVDSNRQEIVGSPLVGDDQAGALLVRLVKALKEALSEPSQMREYYERKEKLADNTPLRIPSPTGRIAPVVSPNSSTESLEPQDPKTEEFQTPTKVPSRAFVDGAAPLSPLAKKVSSLLDARAAVIGKEDRQLLETILKILQKPEVSNEAPTAPVKAFTKVLSDPPDPGALWRRVISRPELSALSERITPEVGSRWTQMIVSLSRETSKLGFFGEQTFQRSLSTLFENLIRPEVTHRLAETGTPVEVIERTLRDLKEVFSAIAEKERPTEPRSEAAALSEARDPAATPSRAKEAEGESRPTTLQRTPSSESDRIQEGLKRPSEGLERAPLQTSSTAEAKGVSVGREMPLAETKEGRPLPFQPLDRVLHIGNNAQYDMIYAGFFDLNGGVFRVDLFHNRKPTGGYQADDYYRIIIEAETERLGTVLVDTFSSNEQLDIVLYTDPRHGPFLTTHSHKLIRRLREDGFSVRLFQIKSLQEKDRVIAQKAKMISGTERGFSRFA